MALTPPATTKRAGSKLDVCPPDKKANQLIRFAILRVSD
jgi:hypothetical protein